MVTTAKDRASKYRSESLQSNEGRAKMFKIAKQGSFKSSTEGRETVPTV